MRTFLLVLTIIYITIIGCVQQNSEAKETITFRDSVTSVYIPRELEFAGEKVPLDTIDVYERLERELIVNRYKHSTTLMLLKRAPRYKEKIIKILREEGVPEDFFYLAAIESEFDPYASSGLASGFWQFTEEGAKENNLEVSEYVEQRYDIIASTYAASNALKKAKEKLGSWTMAAAAFNRGLKAIDGIKKQQHVSSYYSLYLNPETSRYVFRILAIKLLMERPQDYGYYINENEKYKPLTTRTIRVDKSIDDISQFAHDQGINYKTLKYYNPWITFSPTEDQPGIAKSDKTKRIKTYKTVYRFEVPQGKIYYFELPVK